MEVYENKDNMRDRRHTIEIVFQSGEYFGKMTTSIDGNCFGLDILDCVNEDSIYEIDDWEKINCEIELIEDDEDGNSWFRYLLYDKDGNSLEGEDSCDNFGHYIVSVKIIKCEILKGGK